MSKSIPDETNCLFSSGEDLKCHSPDRMVFELRNASVRFAVIILAFYFVVNSEGIQAQQNLWKITLTDKSTITDLQFEKFRGDTLLVRSKGTEAPGIIPVSSITHVSTRKENFLWKGIALGGGAGILTGSIQKVLTIGTVIFGGILIGGLVGLGISTNDVYDLSRYSIQKKRTRIQNLIDETTQRAAENKISFGEQTYWIDLGIGAGRPGFATGVGFTYSVENHIFTLRYTDIILSLSLFAEPNESISDIGILYGRRFKTNFGWISIAGGIAQVQSVRRGEFLYSTGWFGISYYKEIHSHLSGFPFQIEAYAKLSSVCSIGLKGFINWNSERSFMGILLGISLGGLE